MARCLQAAIEHAYKTQGEHMRHGIVCTLALVLACACQPSAGAKGTTVKIEAPAGPTNSNTTTRAGSHVAQSMSKRELSTIVGATCDNPDTGDRCFGGDYDVELLPDCGGLAGVIASKGALLIDKAPPDDSVRRAILSRGQLVCIQAIARAGASPSYYYVVAIGKFDAEKCRANIACDPFGDQKVKWLVPHGEEPCNAVALGRFHGDCAVGWVRESNLVIIDRK